MAHTNVQLVSGNLTTGGDDPTFYIDRVNNKVGIGDVPETSGDDSSNVLQITGSVLATKYHGDGSSLTGIENSQWLHNISDSTKIYYNGGNVGIGEDNPGSKLVVNGDIDIKNGNLKTNGTDAIFSNWATDTNGINRTGNVGIGGVASATNALKVHGTVEATSFVEGGTAISSTYATITALAGKQDVTNSPSFTGISSFGSDGRLHINSRATEHGTETVALQTTIDDRSLAHAEPGTYGGEARNVIALQPDGGFVGIQNINPTVELDVTGNILASGDVTASSDRRLKTDIKRIEGALNKVRTLGGYTFTKNDNPSTGLIAQEVLEVLPEAVHGTEETYYSIAYGNMVGILIEAIKELSDEVKELKEKIG